MEDKSFNRLLAGVAENLGRPDAVPSKEEVEELAARYPYFTVPAAERLASGTVTDPDELKTLKARVALNSPDTETLFRLTDRQGDEFLSGREGELHSDHRHRYRYLSGGLRQHRPQGGSFD